HQLPFHVSRGAQKNFAVFMSRIELTPPLVDVRYCQRVIAMAILFKSVDRIAAAHLAGSYKSMITTYTTARLSLATDRRIDLDRIWREQRISPALEAAIDDLCPHVMNVVVTPREGNHVGEWAKKPACWDAVARLPWTVSRELEEELRKHPLDEQALAGEAGEDEGVADAAAQISAQEWYALERWAKETHNLEPSQRQLAQHVGRRVELGQGIPQQQAAQAIHIRREALTMGFTPEQ
ncbi:AIPR family protein, partial [Streptomonospora salina]